MFGLFKKKQDPASIPSMGGDFPEMKSMPLGRIEPLVDPIDEKPGLEVKFSAGERIPWKGIWFVITRVDKAQMTLVPENMTQKMAKRIEEGQYARR